MHYRTGLSMKENHSLRTLHERLNEMIKRINKQVCVIVTVYVFPPHSFTHSTYMKLVVDRTIYRREGKNTFLSPRIDFARFIELYIACIRICFAGGSVETHNAIKREERGATLPFPPFAWRTLPASRFRRIDALQIGIIEASLIRTRVFTRVG